MKNPILLSTFLTAGVLFTSSTHARNLKLELPISAAINQAAWKTAIGSSVTFEFGTSADPTAQVIESQVPISDFARPYTIDNGTQTPRDGGATCNEALRNALLAAANAAKAKGAGHVVVHYSSYFGDTPKQTKNYYFCNAGINSATVDLVVSYASKQAPAPLKVSPSAPTQSSASARPAPIPSGFADVFDIAKIPYIKEPCRKAYAEWLTKSSPKAFAISEAGFCGFSWGISPNDPNLSVDPNIRALNGCNAKAAAANSCTHYAIDGIVVWKQLNR
jgi:hypothetical protein